MRNTFIWFFNIKPLYDRWSFGDFVMCSYFSMMSLVDVSDELLKYIMSILYQWWDVANFDFTSYCDCTFLSDHLCTYNFYVYKNLNCIKEMRTFCGVKNAFTSNHLYNTLQYNDVVWEEKNSFLFLKRVSRIQDMLRNLNYKPY